MTARRTTKDAGRPRNASSPSSVVAELGICFDDLVWLNRQVIAGSPLPQNADLCDAACAHCGLEGGEVIMCDGRIGPEPCFRIHHLTCLGITAVPRGQWLCPYHFCNDCGRQCTNLCAHCSASWCHQHLPKQARAAKPPPARYDMSSAIGKPKTQGWIVCPQCVDEGPLIR